MSETSARHLEVGQTYREFGDSIDDAVTITAIGYHGDAVLITGKEGFETTLDGDTVVEIVEPKSTWAKVPDFQHDTSGQCYGGAYWSEAEYRVLISVEGEVDGHAILWVEMTDGDRVGHMTLSPEEIDGIQSMAGTNHDLSGYEDDWQIPIGMQRVLTWKLPTSIDHDVVLNEQQITEIAAWLTFAIGDEEWTGGDVWEY